MLFMFLAPYLKLNQWLPISNWFIKVIGRIVPCNFLKCLFIFIYNYIFN
jgi:hypothetical protein